MDLKVNVCAVPQEYAILRKRHSIEQKLVEQNMLQKVDAVYRKQKGRAEK